MANTAAVISQLRALERLTRAEVALAGARVAQARTDAVRRELSRNGDNARGRAQQIATALRDLDAVPDVLAPVMGGALVLVKATMEQTQPLEEALLGDLSVEHQLVDRSRYLLALTDRDGPATVHRLARELVSAHTATVEWLSVVLAEDALGGPAALRPTPTQLVAGVLPQLLRLPGRLYADGINRAAHSLARSVRHARAQAERISTRVDRLGGDAREVLSVGMDSALQRAETLTRRDGSARAADALHTTRRELGALDSDELPVRRYDQLSAQDAVTAIKKLGSPEDVQAVTRYEEEHKNRTSVVSAAQTRHAEIAKDAIAIS